MTERRPYCPDDVKEMVETGRSPQEVERAVHSMRVDPFGDHVPASGETKDRLDQVGIFKVGSETKPGDTVDN